MDRLILLLLERIIEHNINGGINYFVTLGTTGESVTLTNAESRAVLDFILKVVAERVPVVVGFFGGNNTKQTVERIRSF